VGKLAERSVQFPQDFFNIMAPGAYHSKQLRFYQDHDTISHKLIHCNHDASIVRTKLVEDLVTILTG
jgi:hypothetical protein